MFSNTYNNITNGRCSNSEIIFSYSLTLQLTTVATKELELSYLLMQHRMGILMLELKSGLNNKTKQELSGQSMQPQCGQVSNVII